MPDEWRRGAYTVTTDPARIDVDAVHAFLRESYWSPGLPREVLERAIAGSLNFSLLRGEGQAGFARVATDYATFGYVMDVFVLPEHRARGLSVWLMQCILAHPRLQGFRVWRLATRDAHGVYAKVGFTPVAKPETLMEINVPDVYTSPRPAATPLHMRGEGSGEVRDGHG